MGRWTLPYVITLSCGCKVRARNWPMNPGATYSCRYNLGHGHRLAWVSWTDGTKSGYNREEET